MTKAKPHRRVAVALAALALFGCGREDAAPLASKPRPTGIQAQAARPPECRSFYRFEIDGELSIDEIDKLGVEPTRSDPGKRAEEFPGGILVFRGFDNEDVPRRGEWYGVGVIYATYGRADRRPVGGVIWSRQWPTSGGPSFVRGVDDLTARIKTETGPEFFCRGDYVVKLDNKGVLVVDGVRIGGPGA